MFSPSSEHKNVVQLKTESKSSAVPALARMPAPMHLLRDKMRHSLQSFMHALFNKADDALFELADQATNNQEQNLYFDSMREVRLHRRSTEASFFRYLDIGFARLLGVDAYIEDAEVEITSLDDLSLIDNDEQEEIIASETMITRADEKFSDKFEYLSLRVGHLMPVKVEKKRLPMSSQTICDSFIQSTKSVNIDIKAKLVLFKLFDKFVMTELGNMYDMLNQLLVEANVLPSLQSPAQERATRVRSERRSIHRSAASGRRRGDLVDSDTDQFLHTLRDLLSTNGAAPAGHIENQATLPVDASVLSSRDLMSLLSLTQQQNVEFNGGMNVSDVTAQQDVGALVALLQQRSGTKQKINQVDEDVINLVSMMFDFILEDRNLAPPMKAQLARLQIPMIKVAIADKSFFAKGGHPARRLLNEMAMSALGWQDPGDERRDRDNLYQKIDATVQKVLTDFASDMSIFEALLLDFMAFQEKEKRRAKILMQRTIDAEGGKAKSECARTDVDSALKCLTEGVELPAAAQNILSGAWANVLFIARLKNEADSQDWQEHIQTAQDLVWSVTAPMEAGNKKRLLKLVPSLLGRLRRGLEDISYNPYEQGQLFKALEQLHIQKLRKTVKPAPAIPSDIKIEAELAPKEEVLVHKEDKSEVAPKPRNAQEVEQHAETQDTPASELKANEQHMALVSNLRQGSWFEMREAGGETYTCRLAAIIKPTGKYIFVNRSGMKVAEESREDLALALQAGSVRVLDDTMLFDRALESVISNLRASRPKPTEA